MFLALILCQLALVTASPFHKYPYVFLLDIGNEELEKTNTEQIRLTIPGGSLAIRYPAVGNGDTIAHIRVSGIDFGTDLKANIVDGGPGYKYVVLVFMGNQGTPYDAVMTVQTVSDEDIDENQNANVKDGYNYYKVTEDSSEVMDNNSKDVKVIQDENVSAEEIDDLPEENVKNTNAEITQQSSNVYTYVNSADDFGDDDTPVAKDIHKVYSNSKLDAQDVNSNIDDDEDENDDDDSNEPEPSHFEDDYGNEHNDVDDDKENESFSSIDNKANEKYQPVMPLRMYDGLRVYPQYAVPFALPDSDNSGYSPDDEIDSDHTVNDDDQSDTGKYMDSNNNNYFDSDDPSAIAS